MLMGMSGPISIPNSVRCYSSTYRRSGVSVSVRSEEEEGADIVVIGSGIGGLCCGALLARYEEDVLVLESHDQPGGAAHSFDIKGYKFDSGPSLFSGLQSRGPQANPLAQVLDALGESLPCATYDSWMVYIPEGEFLSRIGPTEFFKVKASKRPVISFAFEYEFIFLFIYSTCRTLSSMQVQMLYLNGGNY